MLKSLLIFRFGIFFLMLVSFREACSNPWEIVKLDDPAPGYYKFDLALGYNFYLMDNYGTKQYLDSGSTLITTKFYKLLSNGSWVCNQVSKYLVLDKDLNIIDSIPYPSPELYSTDGHDVIQLKNGHFLLNCLENRVMDLSKEVSGGYKDANIIAGVLVETDNTGEIYWTWKSLDHFKITDYAESDLLKMQNIDFTHINSFVEDDSGNIIISSRHLDEITKIDKKSGDIIWRLGGSNCPANQFTFINDEIDGYFGFSHQHSVSILKNGNILLFDNGNLKPNPYSRAVEYQLDTVNMTATKVWEYRHDPDIYVGAWGSTQRLPNGNTLISWSGNVVIEVKPDNSIAMKMNCDLSFYRAWKYVTKMNVVSKNIISNMLYDFNEDSNRTDIKLDITSNTGGGSATIEKHYYKPPLAEFSDSSFSEILPYRWVLRQSNLKEIVASISIDVSKLDFKGDKNGLVIYKRDKETIGVFEPLITYYNSITNEVTAEFPGFGEFVICYKKVTGVDENICADELFISPNPIENNAVINFKKSIFHNFRLECYDMLGRNFNENIKYFQNGLKSVNIELSGLSNGIYYFLIYNDNKLLAKKFTVQN